MNIKELLDQLDKNDETKEFWKNFLGESLLSKLLKNPELAIIEDKEWMNVTEREKVDFIKDIVGCGVDRSNMLRKEEGLFDCFYEKLGRYTKKVLQKTVVGDFGKDIMDHLGQQIVQRVFWIPFRCLMGDMHEKKMKGKLNGQSVTEEYESYIRNYLRNAERCRVWLEKYPVMVELLIWKIREYAKYVNEMQEHFDQDKEKISKAFHIKQTEMEIIDLYLNQEEEHSSGRMVSRLCLKSGQRIYYKPHALSLAERYQKIEKWLLDSLNLESVVYKMVSGGDYGWELEILENECSNQEEIQEYYYRCGVECCLAYILGMTDIHMENVIANGKYPIIIDKEFMFDRRISVAVQNENLEKNLQDTVMHTGFVPNPIGTMNVNVSVLNNDNLQYMSVKMPVIVNKGTSEMDIVYRYPTLSFKKNLPKYKGEYIGFEDYMEEFIRGFRNAYETIQANPKSLRKMCQGAIEEKGRYLFRNTQEYYMYITSFNFPELMQNPAKRQLTLWHMNRGLHCDSRYQIKVLKYEMQCIYEGITPIFYAEGKNLLMGNGKCIKNYFETDSEEQLDLRIKKISDWDKEFQTKVIQSVFLRYAKNKRNWNGQIGKPQPKLRDLSPEKVAKWLIQSAVRTDDKLEWLNVVYGKGGWTRAGKTDLYLYNGVSGILLFWGLLCKRNKNQEYYVVVSQLTEQLFVHTDCCLNKKKAETIIHWGLFDGEASIAMVYWEMHRLSGEEKYIFYAKKQCRVVLNHYQQIKNNDLIQGRAGIIILLLLMYQTTREQSYLCWAEKVGSDLISTYQLDICLAGMAHGYSGMAVALAMLQKYTEEERYKEIVLELCEKEDRLFDKTTNNWRDMRQEVENPKDTIAWCHGSAGILLARVLIHKISEISFSQLLKGISLNQVLDKMYHTEKNEFCLCHGQAGLLLIQQYIGRVFHYETEYHHNVKKYLEKRLSIEDCLNPGVMIGLAGVGNFLLILNGGRDKDRK